MSIFATLALLVSLAFVPLARRVTGRSSGITYLQRMAIGLAISILGVASAALVETKRRNAAINHGLLDDPIESHRPDQCVLARAAVRHPWRSGGVLVGGPHGVPVRPGAREHAPPRSSGSPAPWDTTWPRCS
ncbi:hypothetical protein PR202_gb01216 [Eleusine coracana subsp. coracana]|uniref:Uncharacterized protein n=1 Tax=Eleusine coracana subsp. coracana TaxID=191504 RepID=A0AAV5DVQ3_ELECO|nr:hypothetical protein PR202_gb01216 [Eleusine coracana subsp. coracana]